MNADDLLRGNMAEHGNFGFCSGLKGLLYDETARDLVGVVSAQKNRVYEERQTRSGNSPRPRSACTVVCVGFVFCSPCISGTNETWINAKFS